MPSPVWLFSTLLMLGLPAVQATGAGSPTEHDMAVWKHDVIDKYDKALYFDERGNGISEQAFFRAVESGRSHTIQSVEGSTKQITLRLLGSADAADPIFTPAKNATVRSLAYWRHNFIEPYATAVYLDERGQPTSEHEFFKVVATERRSVTVHTKKNDMSLITLRLMPSGR